jgi:hypothetical protein
MLLTTRFAEMINGVHLFDHSQRPIIVNMIQVLDFQGTKQEVAKRRRLMHLVS